MSENYIISTDLTSKDGGSVNSSTLSIDFKNAFNSLIREAKTENQSALATCYYMHRLSTCERDINSLGFKSIADFSETQFGFSPATTRTYCNIGSKCEQSNGKVVTCFYDSVNDRDFTRSQMVELQAVSSFNSIDVSKDFSENSTEIQKSANFRTILENVPNVYSYSTMVLRKIKEYLVKLAKYNCELTPENVPSVIEYASSKMKIDGMVFYEDKLVKISTLTASKKTEPASTPSTDNEEKTEPASTDNEEKTEPASTDNEEKTEPASTDNEEKTEPASTDNKEKTESASTPSTDNKEKTESASTPSTDNKENTESASTPSTDNKENTESASTPSTDEEIITKISEILSSAKSTRTDSEFKELIKRVKKEISSF